MRRWSWRGTNKNLPAFNERTPDEQLVYDLTRVLHQDPARGTTPDMMLEGEQREIILGWLGMAEDVRELLGDWMAAHRPEITEEIVPAAEQEAMYQFFHWYTWGN